MGAWWRTVRREVRAVVGIWWLIVPGGIFGLLAIVDAVRSVHHQSVWFWVALAMTALWLATCVRLWTLAGERDAARRALIDDHSLATSASRLETLARECDAMRKEIQDDIDFQKLSDLLMWDYNGVCQRANSELRLQAPQYLAEWQTPPPDLPPGGPTPERARYLLDLAAQQLRAIAEKMRHDT